MLHSLVYIKMCMNHINKSNFIRAKFTQRTLKNLTNHLTPFKCHFGRLIKMVAPLAKIKQVFKVEKLNPQQEETIKSLLHLIKEKNKYTYWYYLSHWECKNCKKARIFITFHNYTCWFRHAGLKSALPKQKSNMHTKHVISLGRKRSQRSCIFDWKQANVIRWTHGWWKRESMRITRCLPTMI